jgi:hypothetical protein
VPVGGAAPTGENLPARSTSSVLRTTTDVVAVGTIAGTVTDLAGSIVGSSLQTVAIRSPPRRHRDRRAGRRGQLPFSISISGRSTSTCSA